MAAASVSRWDVPGEGAPFGSTATSVADEAAASGLARARHERWLTLRGREVTAVPTRGPRRDHGGEQIVCRGTLVDDAGRMVGSFQASAPQPSSPVLASAGDVHKHTFELVDGVLFGRGVPGRLGEAREFRVTGGTGRYRGACGVYTVVLRPANAGGDGSGRFVFDLSFTD